MSEILFPTILVPSSSRVELLDSASRFVSPFTGYTRTVARPGGERIRVTMQFNGLKDEKRAALQAFIGAMRGGVNRAWIRDHSYVQRGSFPATELLGNVSFSATTGWTSSNAEMVLSASEGELRLTRTGVTGNRAAYYTQITGLTSGAAYVARAVMMTGNGPESWGVRVGSGVGDGTYINTGEQNSSGMAVTGGIIGATSAYFSIYDYILDSGASPNEGRSAGDYQRFGGVSFSQGFQVNGGSQTGNAIIVDGLPASTNGLLLPGDQVQICNELKIVTAPLNSDSGGNGCLQFAPSLRESPSDNAPIAVYRPYGKFLLEDQENGWDSVPGIHSSATLTFIEAT